MFLEINILIAILFINESFLLKTSITIKRYRNFSYNGGSAICWKRKSIKALQEVMKTDKSIVLVTQKNSEIDDPIGKDLYQFGCLSKVLQLLKLPDGTVKVLVEGEKRVKILKHNDSSNNFLTCEVEIAEDQNISKELEPLALGLVKKFDKLQILSKKDLNDGSNNLKNLKDPSQIANNISSNLNIQIFEKQELLEIIDLKKD